MTPKQEAALRQALEALTHLQPTALTSFYTIGDRDKAITAIREALAEQPAQHERVRPDSECKEDDGCPTEKAVLQRFWRKAQQQEPVVWMYQNKSTHEVSFQKHMRSFVDHGAWYEVPLYSEPLANQEKTSGSPKPAKPEALRLAELFEVAANAAPEGDEGWLKTAAELRRMHDLLGKANALCRIRAEEIERLKAQPAQEPVAWADLNALTEQFNSVNCGTAYRLPGENRHPFYTSPQPAQHQEPVAYIRKDQLQKAAQSPMLCEVTPEPRQDRIGIFTSPQSKPWVGLTQQDINIAFDDTQEGGGFDDFARAIEAKLREKNAPQQSKEDA